MLDAQPETHLQAERLTTLGLAIADCDPFHAAQLMTAALENMRGAGPGLDFGQLRYEAETWAADAPQHEVQEYAYAALRQLTRNAIGPKARAKIMVAMWNRCGPDERAAFIARVAG
jgi:hypothetical protein